MPSHSPETETGFALSCDIGVATAATQIEGGDAPTIWHRWASRGNARDRSTPAVACDHWNRVAADTELLAGLGIRHYRLGIEWARIEPEPHKIDTAAIDHYREELAGLRDAGITPLVTLHHFNDPAWFSDMDGFTNPRAAVVFARHVGRMVGALGDLASEWVTVNEPNVFALFGHYLGTWPPGHTGLRSYLAALNGMAAGHIAAYEVLHRRQPHARVGVANHLRVFEPADPRNPMQAALARGASWLFQDAVTAAMATGRFRPPLRTPPRVRPGRYADFLGVNYYGRTRVAGPRTEVIDPGAPVNDLGWEIYPDGLGQVLDRVTSWFDGPIYITENGTADASDAFRSRFIYDHLKVIAEHPAPVERYYHWAFTDNWEWAEGQTGRFGLVDLDFDTQVRTPRPSAQFVADVIAKRAVTDGAHARWVAPQPYRTRA